MHDRVLLYTIYTLHTHTVHAERDFFCTDVIVLRPCPQHVYNMMFNVYIIILRVCVSCDDGAIVPGKNYKPQASAATRNIILYVYNIRKYWVYVNKHLFVCVFFLTLVFIPSTAKRIRLNPRSSGGDAECRLYAAISETRCVRLII